MRALETYNDRGSHVDAICHQAVALDLRPFRRVTWSPLGVSSSLKTKLWRIPASRMKMGNEHLVPLSTQAIEVLELLRDMTGHYELVFPSERDRFREMSDNTMRRAIFKMGYDGNTEGKSKAVPHGFRATASSILNETGFNPDAIERQLAHVERSGVRAAYIHHARYLEERREMMQWWADYLDEMRVTGKVVSLFSESANS